VRRESRDQPESLLEQSKATKKDMTARDPHADVADDASCFLALEDLHEDLP
jgi:hypothetical protein